MWNRIHTYKQRLKKYTVYQTTTCLSDGDKLGEIDGEYDGLALGLKLGL